MSIYTLQTSLVGKRKLSDFVCNVIDNDNSSNNNDGVCICVCTMYANCYKLHVTS